MFVSFTEELRLQLVNQGYKFIESRSMPDSTSREIIPLFEPENDLAMDINLELALAIASGQLNVKQLIEMPDF